MDERRKRTIVAGAEGNGFRLAIKRTPIALVVIVMCITISETVPVENRTDVADYLLKFGFLSPETKALDGYISEDVMKEAISKFQSSVGLDVTGNLDDETVSTMSLPRCGVTNKIGSRSDGRSKRFVLEGSRREKTNLTYRISKYSTNLTKEQVDETIARAFRVWSEVSTLTFTQRQNDEVDIDIRFESGDHGDDHIFDGPNGDLAHAHYPRFGGDVHFDDSEPWTTDDSDKRDLFRVAVHEFGHALGIGHSELKSAAMTPLYRNYSSNHTLDYDDIQAIQLLYGKKSVDEATIASPVPELCTDEKLDTVFNSATGQVYAFRGDYYWELTTDGPVPGFPKLIRNSWKGLPGNIDAAFTFTDNRTYFFKGSQYWKYNGWTMDGYYPKQISEGFPGLPRNIDAAVTTSTDGDTFFFKGTEYWFLDIVGGKTIIKNYDISIREGFNGLPDSIDAALNYRGHTFFLKDRAFYYYSAEKGAFTGMVSPHSSGVGLWSFNCETARNTTVASPVKKNPELCTDKKFDTVFNSASGQVYVFRGDYYWELTTNGVAPGYPKLIRNSWKGLPGNIDAAFTFTDNRTYFFKGSQYWKYNGWTMDGYYPKRIREGFRGLPQNIDAAVTLSITGDTIVFKGTEYWILYIVRGKIIVRKYNIPIWRGFNGLPDNIDAALNYGGETYVLKDRAYYHYNMAAHAFVGSASLYSPEAGIWSFGCGTTSDDKSAPPSEESRIGASG